MFYVIVIIVIIAIAGALLTYKLWSSTPKKHETEVVITNVEPGISNVQVNDNLTVVEVSDSSKTGGVDQPKYVKVTVEETPFVKIKTTEEYEVTKVVHKEPPKMGTDLPVKMEDKSDPQIPKLSLLNAKNSKPIKLAKLRSFSVKAHRIAAKKSKRTQFETEPMNNNPQSKRALKIKHNHRIV